MDGGSFPPFFLMDYTTSSTISFQGELGVACAGLDPAAGIA
jgi:hypothetical protein